ncbi:MAG TPA: LysR substrate-binding domain-containing protein [Azoarcus taiwanensis]|nr:LysR substrate-binding domain-containing protein [Azoarcus taiwanensis]
MVFKRRHLPSLGALATFEVAAKHLSFTLAGNELNVTQAAISQQIRGLEKALGTALFVRKHNSLELTSSGQAILAAVSSGLDRISDALNAFNGPAEAPVIACSGTNAASTYWLKPYMDRFSALHPEVRFVLLASDEDDTLRNFDEVDVSFICGNERCDVGETLHYLFPEIVEPVCSPDYLSRHGPFKSPAGLADAELLTLHQKHWSSEAIGWFPITWNDWFSANGAEGPAGLPRVVSNSYPILIEAALAGQGFVLGWHHIVKSLVAEGRLTMPFNAPLRVDRGNYLKVNKSSLGKPFVHEFIEFILADVATIGQGGGDEPAGSPAHERDAQR